MLLLRWNKASLPLEGLHTERDRHVNETLKAQRRTILKNNQSTVFISVSEVNPIQAQQPCYCEEEYKLAILLLLSSGRQIIPTYCLFFP